MSAVKISHIKKPFLHELEKYEVVFAEIMSSDVSLIDSIVKYIVKHKGKNLRPLLVIMSAKLVGTPNRNTFIIASIIELLHTATLIHDDVVDDAELRRGFPSINKVWKNKIAVLIGDYLLSKCLIGGTKTGSLDVMNALADSAKRLSKGELLQIEKSKTLNINEKQFFQIISDKTAALIATASSLGALSVSDNKQDHINLKNYGENLGIAFQIKDDLLDYYGNLKLLGKPVGNDFKDKKITLPLIHAFRHARKNETKYIKSKIRKGVKTKKEIEELINFAEKYNGIDYASGKQQEYAENAKKSICSYPDSEVKQSLLNFVDYVIERKL